MGNWPLAALLYPLGLATVPKDILDKRKSGIRLSEPESFALAQSGVAAGQLVAKIPKLERVATYLRYSRKGRDGSGLPPLEDDLDTPQSAIYLLPLLIDIVELSDIRDISLRDAAMALRDDPKYHAHMLSITIDELMKRAKTQAQERVVKDVSIAEIRVGDILINDLRGDSGELLLTGGSQLTDLLLKRLKTLAENRTIRNRLRLDALHKSAIRFGPHTAFFGRAVQLACYRARADARLVAPKRTAEAPANPEAAGQKCLPSSRLR